MRVATPAELAATIPDLFGFQVAESAVMLAIDGRRVSFAARLDLADLTGPDAGDRLAQFARQARQADTPSVMVFGFSNDPERAWAGVNKISAAMTGMDHVGRAVVSGGRVQTCAGGAWQQLPGRPKEAVEAMRPAPLGSRAELAATIAQQDGLRPAAEIRQSAKAAIDTAEDTGGAALLDQMLREELSHEELSLVEACLRDEPATPGTPAQREPVVPAHRPTPAGARIGM